MQPEHFDREKKVAQRSAEIDGRTWTLCSGDLKTDESDDCDLGDCPEPEASLVIRGSSLLTADAGCTGRPPGPDWGPPLECQVSRRLSPLCRSALNDT